MTLNISQLKTNPIQRKLISPGLKDIESFNNGDRVTFHFKTLLVGEYNDETTCEELLSRSEVVDDSRKEKPMQLIFGKQFKLSIWEECIRCMKVEEVSAFLCDVEHVTPYPLVSKTLRDAWKGLGHQRTPCCGTTLAAEGLGYDDLNELMKEPKPLIFIIDLVKYERHGEYNQDSWAMDLNERLEAAATHREVGNRLYKQGDYNGASDEYEQAVSHLENLLLREKPGCDEYLELEDRKLTILLNYSQCQLKLGDYYKVIEHTSTVLDKQPDNMKALFRRGCAYVQVYEPEKAEKDFLTLKSHSDVDEGTLRVVEKQRKTLEVERRKKDAHDRVMYSGKLT